jgi:hypothetical protein
MISSHAHLKVIPKAYSTCTRDYRAGSVWGPVKRRGTQCFYLWLWRRRLSLRPCACAQCRVLPLDLMQLLVAIKRHGTHARCSTKPHNKYTLSVSSRDNPPLVSWMPARDHRRYSRQAFLNSIRVLNASLCSLQFNAKANASGVLHGLAKIMRPGLTPLLRTCTRRSL